MIKTDLNYLLNAEDHFQMKASNSGKFFLNLAVYFIVKISSMRHDDIH
jgi:hypothetical protein